MTNRRLADRRGVTLIELLVATCIGCVVGLALSQQVIMAHGARRSGAKWMRATQLAAERLERVRAGDRSKDDDPHHGFAVSWQSHAVPGYPDLAQVAVTVVWEDHGEERFTLEALMPEGR